MQITRNNMQVFINLTCKELKSNREFSMFKFSEFCPVSLFSIVSRDSAADISNARWVTCNKTSFSNMMSGSLMLVQKDTALVFGQYIGPATSKVMTIVVIATSVPMKCWGLIAS